MNISIPTPFDFEALRLSAQQAGIENKITQTMFLLGADTGSCESPSDLALHLTPKVAYFFPFWKWSTEEPYSPGGGHSLKKLTGTFRLSLFLSALHLCDPLQDNEHFSKSYK